MHLHVALGGQPRERETAGDGRCGVIQVRLQIIDQLLLFHGLSVLAELFFGAWCAEGSRTSYEMLRVSFVGVA